MGLSGDSVRFGVWLRFSSWLVEMGWFGLSLGWAHPSKDGEIWKQDSLNVDRAKLPTQPKKVRSLCSAASVWLFICILQGSHFSPVVLFLIQISLEVTWNQGSMEALFI